MHKLHTSLPAALRLGRNLNDWLTNKLSRVTSSGDLIPEIDGLRFIAIALVLFHHLLSVYLTMSGRGEVRTPAEWFAAGEQSWLVLPAYCGHFGVHLFFVISGFILALPFAKRAFNELPAPDLKSYYLRRITRIEPPYVLCLLVCFFLIWAQSGAAAQMIPHLLASLLYAHGLIYGHESLINGVTWSLEIEIQFYLLVPLLVGIFKLRTAHWRRVLLLALIIGFGVLSQWVIYPYSGMGAAQLRLSLFNFLHYFLTGFLLADLYLTGWLREAKKRVSWDVITIAATLAIGAVLSRYGHLYFLLPLLVGLLYASFFRGRLMNAFIRLRWLVVIGGMCYTIYLYHILLISSVVKQTMGLASLNRAFNLDFALQCLLLVPMVLAACGLIFVYTEKPFMRWSLSNRRRAPIVVEAQNGRTALLSSEA